MNLQCSTELASAYKSGSQIARILTEAWCARELYCPACVSDRLLSSKVNTPVIDFTCPVCGQLFQLKSLRRWNPKTIPRRWLRFHASLDPSRQGSQPPGLAVFGELVRAKSSTCAQLLFLGEHNRETDAFGAARSACWLGGMQHSSRSNTRRREDRPSFGWAARASDPSARRVRTYAQPWRDSSVG